MKVFIWNADELIGQSILSKISISHSVFAVFSTPNSQRKQNVTTVDKESKEAVVAALLESDVIIYPAFGINDETEPTEFAVQTLHDSSYAGKKTFIMISTVLTWARSGDNDENEPDPDAVFTEEDFRKRKPHPSFKHYLSCEKLVSRLRKKDSLNTIVVAAGLVYGKGEWMLHGLFKDAWTLKQPALACFGKGANSVPMVHVDDLAGTVVSLATMDEASIKSRYVVCVDEAKNTLAEIVEAINRELGTGNPITYLKPDEVLLLKDIELFLIDLKLDATSARETEYEFKYAEGFVARIGDVVTEYRRERGLTPVKILVHGPPASGKTRLCEEIARYYHIHHVQLQQVIAQYMATCSEGELEEVQAAKEENNKLIPNDLLIRIVRRHLRQKSCANQGYVLDGFPKSLEQCKILFGEQIPVPKTAKELAELGSQYPEEFDAEGEEGEDWEQAENGPQKKPNIFPQFVLALEASDEFLADRVMSLPQSDPKSDPERFRTKLETFRLNNMETNTLLNYFEERDVEPLVCNAETETDILSKLVLRVGNPHNYGPTVAEVLEQQRQVALQEDRNHELRRAEQERLEHEENERRRKRDERERERLKAIQQQEKDNLDVHAMPLRKYLLDNVMPTVTEALIEICKVRPEDPLDYLAEYLFRASPEKSL